MIDGITSVWLARSGDVFLYTRQELMTLVRDVFWRYD